jgi:hypothetical protein
LYTGKIPEKKKKKNKTKDKITNRMNKERFYKYLKAPGICQI